MLYRTDDFIFNAILLGIFSVIMITVLTFNFYLLGLMIPIFAMKKIFLNRL